MPEESAKTVTFWVSRPAYFGKRGQVLADQALRLLGRGVQNPDLVQEGDKSLGRRGDTPPGSKKRVFQNDREK
jgi:hypothetical protein